MKELIIGSKVAIPAVIPPEIVARYSCVNFHRSLAIKNSGQVYQSLQDAGLESMNTQVMNWLVGK